MLANLLAAALTGVIAIPGSAAHAPSQISGIYMTGVSLGAVDPNNVVPTANGVPNAGTANWDIALPLGVLHAGDPYKLTLTFEDAGYKGPCNIIVRMTQVQSGKKVVLREVRPFAGQCSPNIFMASTDFHEMPNAPGPVTLTATIHYGAEKSSTKVDMLIQ